MRLGLGYALIFSVLPLSSAFAQKLPAPEDAEMPTAFIGAVTDVCFGVAHRNVISPESGRVLKQTLTAPPELSTMYPPVKTWYRLKKEPEKVFIGIGDSPNRCHVVLINSKDGRQAFQALSTLLRSLGFTGAWDARGSATLIMTKKWGASNLLVMLRGLTDASDGVGPQVAVDLGSASDEKLQQLLGGK